MTSSIRKTGYYHALVAGAADADVILYYDGEHLYAHGSAEAVAPGLILYIREEPISFERPDGSHDAPLIGIDEWLTME
jgi:hypothetical protein